MICSKCGQECADGLKFCTNCGAELVEIEVVETTEMVTGTVIEGKAEVVAEEKITTEVAIIEEAKETKENEKKKAKKEKAVKTDADEKKPFGKGKLVLACVAILLLIFIPAVLLSGDDSYMKRSKDAIQNITEDDGTYYVRFADGESMKLDDSDVTSEVYSMDRSAVCYFNEDDELVIIKDREVIRTGIDEAYGVRVSNEGKTVAYFSDYELASYDNTLYGGLGSIAVGTLNLYYIKNGETLEIAEEAVINSAVLSPNGETVAYVAEYDASDDFKGFYSVKGKEPVEVGKEKRVFAIADKGAYVYYSDDDRIYAQKKRKEEEKLASDLYNVNVFMNADHTEMLFWSDEKTYATVKAGEKKKVAGEQLNYAILENDAVTDAIYLSTEQRGTITVNYTGLDTFKEKLYYSNYNSEIFYMLKKFEAEKIASNVSDYAVADNGESIVYIYGSDIIKATRFAKGGEKTKLLNNADAYRIYADGKLKHIYFLNWEDELCYVKGKKGKRIADDVTTATVSADGSYCYYVVEGEEFCFSKNGGKEKELLTVDEGYVKCEFDLDDLGEEAISPEKVLVKVKEDDTITYYLMDGKKMKEFYSYEVSVIDEFFDYDDYSDFYDSMFDY
ncbi:MAG: zinc ribbon domain-containing protein [Lachnospiraceae bacterium]|nr:zinc ribbon domain-containing protein [Lachnospiraceae bacterium]